MVSSEVSKVRIVPRSMRATAVRQNTQLIAAYIGCDG